MIVLVNCFKIIIVTRFDSEINENKDQDEIKCTTEEHLKDKDGKLLDRERVNFSLHDG